MADTPKPISDADIDVIAKAMAEANKIGGDSVPERDVVLYHERARLFLAANAALPNVGKTAPAEPAKA